MRYVDEGNGNISESAGEGLREGKLEMKTWDRAEVQDTGHVEVTAGHTRKA